MSEQVRERSGTTVVVGVDSSDTAAHALAYGIGVARRQHARLLLVHALPFDDYRFDVTGRFRAALPIEHDTGWLDELVAEMTADLDLEVRVVRCQGDRVPDCWRPRRHERADLIVVGQSHGVLHRLAGAVGRRAAARAPVPVMVRALRFRSRRHRTPLLATSTDGRRSP